MLEIRPVESYEAPKIPTFGEDNSAMLKKLPKRWQKNAKVLACIGIMGTVTLSSLAFPFANVPSENGEQRGYVAEYSGYNEFDLTIRTHIGGAIGIPFYVVYLTEQEALGIIQTKLEEAGFNFGAIPPEYTVNPWSAHEFWRPHIGLDLFDKERNVAISKVSIDASTQRFMPTGSAFAEMVAEEFAKQTDIPIGVFFSSGKGLGRDWQRGYQLTTEQNVEIGEYLKENLTAQVDRFIERLQQEGILAPIPPEITVKIDGEAIEFDIAPMIVDNRTMVPMRAIFEALGMEVAWNAATQTVFGFGNGRSIEITVGAETAIVSPVTWRPSTTVELDTPAIIYENRTFVPLRFIAEATGAIVNWDERTRTVAISTDYDGVVLSRRSHGGGSGGVPFYVVHLTEQEMYGIIRGELEKAGLDFSSSAPEKTAVVSYSVEVWVWDESEPFGERLETQIRDAQVGFDLFDAGRGVGIAKIGERNQNFADLTVEAFTEQFDGVTPGVFRTLIHEFEGFGPRPSAAEKSEASAALRVNLTNQVNKFIEFLREEGIL